MRSGVFSKKPSLAAAINWNHPLAQGLVACFVINEGGGPLRDLVTGQVVPLVGSGARSMSRIGEVLDGSTANDSGAAATAWDGLKAFNAKEWSIAYRGLLNASPSAFSQLAGVTHANTDTSSFQAYALEHNNDGTQYRLAWTNGAGFENTMQGSPISAWDGTERLVVGAVDGANNRLYEMKHGSPLTTVATNSQASGPFDFTATSRLGIGVYVAGIGRNAKGLAQLAYFYNRKLIPADVQMLWISPFGFLQPARQNFGLVAVASTAKFRRTLSPIGARIGSRQGV
jgi:hypothetical protein